MRYIVMNFMKCIGYRINGSGLNEMWMECELLASVAVKNILREKHFNRGMMAHKMTTRALSVS